MKENQYKKGLSLKDLNHLQGWLDMARDADIPEHSLRAEIVDDGGIKVEVVAVDERNQLNKKKVYKVDENGLNLQILDS